MRAAGAPCAAWVSIRRDRSRTLPVARQGSPASRVCGLWSSWIPKGPSRSRHAAVAQAATDAVGGDDEDPRKVLRVGPGTTFRGLLAARREAKAKAKDEEGPEGEAKVERAFRRIIAGAEDKFKVELEEQPNDAQALYNYGNFCQSIEDFAMAESLYQRCLAFDPEHFDALNNLATLESEVKQNYSYAAELLEKSLEIDPDSVDAMFNLACIKRDFLDDVEAGNALVQRILQIEPRMSGNPLIEGYLAGKAAPPAAEPVDP